VLEYLNRISTNKVDTLEVNKSIRTIFANEKGKILDSVLLCNFGDYQLLIGNLNNSERLLSWIKRFIISEDIHFENKIGQMSLLSFVGNKTDELSSSIFVNIEEPLTEYSVLNFTYNNTKSSLIRVKDIADYKSFIAISYIDVLEDIKEQLLSQNKYPYPIEILPSNYYNYIRVINGIPNKNEMAEFFTPNELLLHEEIDFKKGCYVGQEVIARLETYNKVQKIKTVFEFLDRNLTDNKFVLYDASNNEIGKISSIAENPSTKELIGLGVLRKSFIKPNQVLNAKGIKSLRGYKVKIYNPEEEI